MKREHVLVIIIGLLVLSYVLDAVVNPLAVNLATPYAYFNADTLFEYAFTTTSILMKGIALFAAPILALRSLGVKPMATGLSLFVLSVLLQLYAVQDIASGAYVVPLEWSIGFTLAGLFLLPAAILFIIAGLFKGVLNNIAGHYEPDEIPRSGSENLERLKP
jgi:hypothetical protein